ncbi:SBBP repeat-containing protein [Anatilimnocola floriformis]|uniref:SBBP repeat-containing protein n=1 Tax=Anatilimnocola floriformis TaxID=2948575 RepID=UPI0020C48BC7|nr:SBBP repeat-containing protein [Anatilimnocola floriformis]
MSIRSVRRARPSSSAKKDRQRASPRFRRPQLWAEKLEPRLCLYAEFVEAYSSADSLIDDTYDDIVFDNAGNYYTSGTKYVTKFAADGSIVWKSTVVDGAEMAVDAMGSVYVTGRTSGTRTFAGPTNSISVTTVGQSDVFVVKLDSFGDPAWVKTMGGLQPEFFGGIAATPEGDVVVAATFQTTAYFGPTTLVSQGNRDIFVSRLSTNGDFQWTRQIGGPDSQEAFSVALDANGNAYVTGETHGVMNLVGSRISLSTYHQALVAKLTPTGDWAWGKAMGAAPNWADGRSIAIDPAGYVVTVGGYGGPADFDPGPDDYSLPTNAAGTPSDMFLQKMDLDGNFVWARGIGGGVANQVVVGPDRKIYFVGNYGTQRLQSLERRLLLEWRQFLSCHLHPRGQLRCRPQPGSRRDKQRCGCARWLGLRLRKVSDHPRFRPGAWSVQPDGDA